jgi:hypothetical protein
MTGPKHYLCSILPIGATVYTIQTGRSRSGMVRRLRALAAFSGRVVDISAAIANAADLAYRDDSLEVRGAGFSASQHVAQSLAQVLYGDVSALRGESL